MSWRYAYIILDSPFYKRSGLLHPSSQQSVTTCSTLKFYFQSSIFNSNKEFTSDTWTVEHCKEFIAPFIYLSFCGQISHCDHFSHIPDRLSVYSDQMHSCQTPVSWDLLRESSRIIWRYLSLSQHQSVFKNFCSLHADLPVEKDFYWMLTKSKTSTNWIPLGHDGMFFRGTRAIKQYLPNNLLCLLKYTCLLSFSHVVKMLLFSRPYVLQTYYS